MTVLTLVQAQEKQITHNDVNKTNKTGHWEHTLTWDVHGALLLWDCFGMRRRIVDTIALPCQLPLGAIFGSVTSLRGRTVCSAAYLGVDCYNNWGLRERCNPTGHRNRPSPTMKNNKNKHKNKNKNKKQRQQTTTTTTTNNKQQQQQQQQKQRRIVDTTALACRSRMSRAASQLTSQRRS